MGRLRQLHSNLLFLWEFLKLLSFFFVFFIRLVLTFSSFFKVKSSEILISSLIGSKDCSPWISLSKILSPLGEWQCFLLLEVSCLPSDGSSQVLLLWVWTVTCSLLSLTYRLVIILKALSSISFFKKDERSIFSIDLATLFSLWTTEWSWICYIFSVFCLDLGLLKYLLVFFFSSIFGELFSAISSSSWSSLVDFLKERGAEELQVWYCSQ